MCDDFAERAAILEFDAKYPREWAESLARLDTAAIPAGFTHERWVVVVDDGFRLVARWLPEIRRNDWSPADVKGLIPLIAGREVIAIGRGEVTVQAVGFPPEKIYRRPSNDGSCRWDNGRRAA
ncbi:MAG: hypothetical protein WCF85_16280 [Rhodospirillaceae bacterium]